MTYAKILGETDTKPLLRFIKKAQSNADAFLILNTMAQESDETLVNKRFVRMALFSSEYHVIGFCNIDNELEALLIVASPHNAALASKNTIIIIIPKNRAQYLGGVDYSRVSELKNCKLKLITPSKVDWLESNGGFTLEAELVMQSAAQYFYFLKLG